MAPPITSDLVEAYSSGPRKAFLTMAGASPAAGPHAYEVLIRGQAEANRQAHRDRLAKVGEVVRFRDSADPAAGRDVLADLEPATGALRASYDVLAKPAVPSRLGRHGYEPVRVIGTCRASRADSVGLAFQGPVLGGAQGRQPAPGTLVRLGGRPCKVRPASRYKQARRVVEALRAWADGPGRDAPPVVLNKHCPSRPFRDACLQQAEQEDDLSLLDRMAPTLMREYHDRGIFTVRQLSHAYKPRRIRKKARRQVRHSLGWQALATRTGKIHVEHWPHLPRGPLELVVDPEGVPDKDAYYLAGLLVCRAGSSEYEPFWADDAAGEAAMCAALVERLEAFPDAPIYHYGSYEKEAFAALAKRHGGGGGLARRLVNVASSVYGRVYSPVRSNGPKPLGRSVGAGWTDTQASGLQSLVWRHSWGARRDERAKRSLLQYNREGCEAVRLPVDCLDRIRQDAAPSPTIDFAHRPKQTATERGREARRQFERILREAEEDGRRRSVGVRPGDTGAESGPKKRGHERGTRPITGSCRRRPTGRFASGPNAGAPRATATSPSKIKPWPRRH